jgi:hypothetical protein
MTEQGHVVADEAMSWIDAMAFMRLEEIREDVRRELDEAARWTVTAMPMPCMAVRVGPHQVAISAAWPARGRVDLVTVALKNGQVVIEVIVGTTMVDPSPASLLAGSGYPLAWVNVHAGSHAIGPWNITPVPPAVGTRPHCST